MLRLFLVTLVKFLENRIEWYGEVTDLHSFTYGVLKVPSLICDSSSVLKFSSNERVFERLFFLRHDSWSREDGVKF